MGLFKQLHKSAFWSQLFLGMVAILAMPNAQVANDADQNPIAQTLNLTEFTTAQQTEVEQVYFLSQTSNSLQLNTQTVSFCEFFAKPYRLLSASKPPIRAGPCHIIL